MLLLARHTNEDQCFSPPTYNKEHLSLVIVRQEKEACNGAEGDFVVVSLSMSPKETWEHFNGVSPSVSSSKWGNMRRERKPKRGMKWE